MKEIELPEEMDDSQVAWLIPSDNDLGYTFILCKNAFYGSLAENDLRNFNRSDN